MGYEESGSAACNSCGVLPNGAHWVVPASDAAYIRCAVSCDPGLYGHPTAGGGSCLVCSLYMQSQVAAGLSPPPPAVGGIWNNTAGSCNADSWACAPGFRRSPAGDRYCCPLSIAHASPAGPGGGGPCEVTCNAGFWWNVSAANCTACSGLPAEAEWLSSAAANGQVYFLYSSHVRLFISLLNAQALFLYLRFVDLFPCLKTSSIYSCAPFPQYCSWACNVGFFALAPATLAAGASQCAACANAPTDAVYTGSGSVSGGCPWQCAAGYYLVVGTCTPCPTGTYAPSSGLPVEPLIPSAPPSRRLCCRQRHCRLPKSGRCSKPSKLYALTQMHAYYIFLPRTSFCCKTIPPSFVLTRYSTHWLI